MKLYLLALVLFSILSPLKLHSQIIYGTKVAQLQKPLDLGIVKIPWSRANTQYGYLYEIPGLTFGNVQQGFWTELTYLSYSGIENISDVSDISIFDFSSTKNLSNGNYDYIVFADSNNNQNHYNNIVLFKYNDIYGGIEFVDIGNDYSLLYNYWYDDSGIGNFSSLANFDSNIVSNFKLNGLYRNNNLNLIFNWEYPEFRDFDVAGFKMWNL